MARPEQALLAGAGAEGVVYVSMGTLCNFGPEEFVHIAAALSALRHTVVWKLAPGDLPGNATTDSLGLAPNVKAPALLVPAPPAPLSPPVALGSPCAGPQHCTVPMLIEYFRDPQSSRYLIGVNAFPRKVTEGEEPGHRAGCRLGQGQGPEQAVDAGPCLDHTSTDACAGTTAARRWWSGRPRTTCSATRACARS